MEIMSILRPRDMVATVVSFFVGGVLAFLYLNSVGIGPSVVTDNIPFEVDGVAQRGGHIDIHYDVTRKRACLSRATRILWREWPNGDAADEPIKQMYFLNDTGTAFMDFGEEHVIVSIPLPPGIEPGQWNYRSTVTEQCGWWPAIAPLQIRVSPDVPIQITSAGGQQFGMVDR